MADLNTLSNNVRWRNEVAGFLSTQSTGVHQSRLPENYILVVVHSQSLKLIALDGEKISKTVTIEISQNYPFHPPTVKIGEASYIQLLGDLHVTFRKMNIRCPCCTSILCRDNWGPCSNIKNVLEEIYQHWQNTKYYRLMVLIKKVMIAKIGTHVPIHTFLLPASFNNLYFKFQELPE